MSGELTPNTQITQENVGLLKAGDWLRGMWDGSLWMFDRLTISPGRMVVRRPYKGTTEEAREEVDAFTYIGPDRGDGWIGWSGGENPVPGMRVMIEARASFWNDKGLSSDYCWQHVPHKDALRRAQDIIAFRPDLSPPAEVPFAAEDACLACNSPTLASVDWQRVGRDLDALRYVLNFADEAKQVRTIMSAFTMPERETTVVRLERLYATIKALAPTQPKSNGE